MLACMNYFSCGAEFIHPHAYLTLFYSTNHKFGGRAHSSLITHHSFTYRFSMYRWLETFAMVL